MSSTKKRSTSARIIFWVTTIIFVLFESGGALFSNSQPAIDGMRHLGFPDYFRIELGIGKVIGGIILIIPGLSPRIKEWAYVGFGITVISAIIANMAVDGVGGNAWMPVLVFILLTVSYRYYHKTKNH